MVGDVPLVDPYERKPDSAMVVPSGELGLGGRRWAWKTAEPPGPSTVIRCERSIPGLPQHPREDWVPGFLLLLSLSVATAFQEMVAIPGRAYILVSGTS